MTDASDDPAGDRPADSPSDTDADDGADLEQSPEEPGRPDASDDRERPAPEVLVVPSHYSDLGRIADQLVRQGYDVLDVGSDDWDPVASLLPYVRDADVVVCSGYSTVMDAAVAGTPCVVHPATDEQDAVAGWLDRFDVPGFAVAPEPLDVLEAVDSPPDPPDFENGAGVVAETVMDDVTDGGSATAGSSGSDPATLGRTGTAADRTDAPDDRGRAAVGAARARVGATRRRSADRLVAGATALGTALPSSPAFVGTYHYFSALGISFLGVDDSVAASFALVAHAVAFVPFTLVGLAVFAGYLRTRARTVVGDGGDG